MSPSELPPLKTPFRAFEASSKDRSLEEVLEHLQSRDEVVAIARLGSTARQIETSSDYDLLLVLEDGPDFDVEFTWIGGRETDVIFLGLDAVRRLLAEGPSSSRDGDVLRWLATARVESSRSETFDALCQVAPEHSASRVASDREIYFRWVEANFNLTKARRWLSAPADRHALPLAVHLARCLAAVLPDYLACRRRAWLGEKAGVASLLDSDPEFLDELDRAFHAKDLREQVACYERLLSRVFEPVGVLWAAGETAGGWLRPEGSPQERSLWEKLLRE